MLCVAFFHIPNPLYREKRQQKSDPCLNDRTPSLKQTDEASEVTSPMSEKGSTGRSPG